MQYSSVELALKHYDRYFEIHRKLESRQRSENFISNSWHDNMFWLLFYVTSRLTRTQVTSAVTEDMLKAGEVS